LKYASDRLKNDIRIVEMAITNNFMAFSYASEELKNFEKLKEIYNKKSQGKIDWLKLSNNETTIEEFTSSLTNMIPNN
jgi:hypothetical protein